ncbi:sulfatase-like hydrolase/transferase [Bythopirellula polymerisocia]|uniref:Arylsulfatase n=1 Tax=Bythopirellula polymerisocia TaxID=2528003 RepID=A0A5C6CG64_9BACT|nr:sulfatase-like hydrolase/transferase [Bythopirellula polymerisocia]TWU22707.1 Arylsulfatase [Bythopirellula polymerisocia]
MRSAQRLLHCFVLTYAAVWVISASAVQRPNTLLILADDMGYGDMSCLGSETVSTPHLDALVEEGVLCTQAYVASSVCSPSRAGLITGRDPRRFGYEGNLNSEAETYASRPELLGLPVQEHTLADHLKPLGYATALVGKWHLGDGERFHPNRRGFDYFCGMLNGGHDYFPQADKNHLERNGQPIHSFSSPYLTDFFTDEAVRWISETTKRTSDKAWFLYLSYNAPHTPMQATEEDLAACRHVKNPERRTYAAMMRALDRGIGRVIQSLQDTGQRENTLIVFLSDNGGATNNASWNGPLSGAKGSLREGGVRVPMILSWPGQFAPKQLGAEVVSSLDLLPTFLAAAGGAPLALADAPTYHDRHNEAREIKKYGEYDGINLLPMLRGQQEIQSRKLFWRLQGQAAIRSGDLKLIRLSHRPAQLFQMADDIGEQNDLAPDASDDLNGLFTELAEWEAMLPTVPIWDSSPRWCGDSAKIYDTWMPREEPR